MAGSAESPSPRPNLKDNYWRVGAMTVDSSDNLVTLPYSSVLIEPVDSVTQESRVSLERWISSTFSGWGGCSKIMTPNYHTSTKEIIRWRREAFSMRILL
ncbi:hypothetical protein JTB14_007197 [Gonioctena quinquepunctata]|nr:hypothetical protein JTB14_007197 [Gonioctena quinquepunctata]